MQKSKKSACFIWMYGLSSNDYGVAALSKSYLTVMQSFKSIGQFYPLFKLTKRANRYIRTDPNYRKASLFKNLLAASPLASRGFASRGN